MSKTIREIFGLNAVDPLSNAYAKEKPPEEQIKSDHCLGIEVEVENAPDARGPKSGVWRIVGDGSLRNYGVEFVSLPIQAHLAPFALRELLDESLRKECCFSPRTSIHVHVNAQDMIAEQMQNISLIYGVLEPLLYQFVGKNRNKNIYCVPIHDTALWQQFTNRKIHHVVEGWKKYTGFNLKPLAEHGTMEFRAMHGTFDYRKVTVWIRLLIKMVEYGSKADTKVLRKFISSLDEATDVDAWIKEIFGEDAQHLGHAGQYSKIKHSVNAVRQAFTKQTDAMALQSEDIRATPYFQFKREVA